MEKKKERRKKKRAVKGEFGERNPCEAPLAKIPRQDCRGQEKTCFWLSAVEAVGSAPKSGSSVGCRDPSPWCLGSSAPLFPGGRRSREGGEHRHNFCGAGKGDHPYVGIWKTSVGPY